MHIPRNTGSLFVLGFLLLAVSLPLAAKGSAETGDSQTVVVATVNKKTITSVDLDREIMFIQQQLLQQGRFVDQSMFGQFQEEALDTLINRELLYQESQREGVQADPSTVEQSFQSYRSQFPDEEAFKQSLAEVQHTPESFREDLRRGLTVQKFVDDGIGASIQISEAESRKFYEENPSYFTQPEQVRARHILILVEEGEGGTSKQEALAKIKEIQAAVSGGGDFAELAREHSEDPGSGPQGGDLGYFSRGQMVPPFEEAAFSLEPGEVSEIVETDYGFHLIELIDHREEGVVPFAEVRPSIDEYLERVEVLEEVNLLLDRLREGAQITKSLPQPPAAAPSTPATPPAPAK